MKRLIVLLLVLVPVILMAQGTGRFVVKEMDLQWPEQDWKLF